MPLFVGVVLLYDNRVSLLGSTVVSTVRHHRHTVTRLEPALDTTVTAVTVVLLVILGWAIARDVGRGLGPALFRRGYNLSRALAVTSQRIGILVAAQ